MKNHPTWTRNEIRKAQQAAYAVLHNIDKDLLFSVLPKVNKAAAPRTNWVMEDQKMLDAIKALSNIELLSRSAISRKVTNGWRLIKALDRMPQTNIALRKLGK